MSHTWYEIYIPGTWYQVLAIPSAYRGSNYLLAKLDCFFCSSLTFFFYIFLFRFFLHLIILVRLLNPSFFLLISFRFQFCVLYISLCIQYSVWFFALKSFPVDGLTWVFSILPLGGCSCSFVCVPRMHACCMLVCMYAWLENHVRVFVYSAGSVKWRLYGDCRSLCVGVLHMNVLFLVISAHRYPAPPMPLTSGGYDTLPLIREDGWHINALSPDPNAIKTSWL